jgi:hypothetical protein
MVKPSLVIIAYHHDHPEYRSRGNRDVRRRSDSSLVTVDCNVWRRVNTRNIFGSLDIETCTPSWPGGPGFGGIRSHELGLTRTDCTQEAFWKSESVSPCLSVMSGPVVAAGRRALAQRLPALCRD